MRSKVTRPAVVQLGHREESALSETTSAGSNNTATGTGALAVNTIGDGNTASGFQALFNNTDGFSNTAIGDQALHNNTSGSDNVALGAGAGELQTTGDHNIYIAASGAAAESGTIRIGNNIHTSRAFIAGISGVTVPGGVAVIIDANGHLGTNASSARFQGRDQAHGQGKRSDPGA